MGFAMAVAGSIRQRNFSGFLRMGVWARKQMEDQKNTIGKDMLRTFWDHETKLPERRRKRAIKIETDNEIKERTRPSVF
jgi:hypothetical protein